MNLLEQLSFSLRHSQYLEGNEKLWNFLRPIYNSFLDNYCRNGLIRNINGSDQVLVSPKFRNTSEIYEPEVWNHIMKNIRLGDTVADVGAFIGLYSIAIAKRIGPNGQLFAFEPDPDNFSGLHKNVNLNKVFNIVEAVNKAVGDKDSTVYFQSGNGLQSSIQPEALSSGISIECVSLDKFFKKKKLDILKIDVEGFEEKVLIGATNLLRNRQYCPRILYIEVHPFAWPNVGTTWDSLLDFLRSHDYSVTTLDNRSPREINWWGEIIAHKVNI